MDANRFDAFTKAWARGTSRRTILTGVLGGLIGLAGHDEAAAFICRQGGVLCAKDAHCCSGSCGDDHRCACLAEQIPCGRRCCAADQLCTDAAHGRCCTPATCAAGQCGELADGCGGTITCDCPSGEQCTSGRCVTTTTTTTPQPCLTAGSCCTDAATCEARCCTGLVGRGLIACGGEGWHCTASFCGGACASTNDCFCVLSDCTCVDSTCTCPSGTTCSGVGACLPF